MESRQAKFVYGSMVLVVFCWLVSPTVGNVQEPVWVLRQIPLEFDARRACEMTREFVTRFPRRVIGSFESRNSTGFLQSGLASLGYEVSYLQFDATIKSRRQVGRDVLAFKPGQVPETIAVLAHYDTATTTYQGAMDDGSGVGVLLELARVLELSPTRRSLLFVATDGEEWGMLGSRDLEASYPGRARIAAALSLDGVAIGNLAEIELGTSGQMGGYSPPWLRQIAYYAAIQILPVSEPSGVREHFERALLLSSNDQGPLLDGGIPAINLGSNSIDKPRQSAVYHSAQDTIDNLDPASVEKYGRIAEKIVRTIDGLPAIPKESMGSFRLKDTIFLSAKMMSFLHFLTFLPLLAAGCIYWVNHRKYLTAERVWRELLAFAGTLLPFLAVYYTIILLSVPSAIRSIPGYSQYPATAKDPVLENPSWKVISCLTAAALAVAAICYFAVRFLCRKPCRPDFHVSKLILLNILVVVSILALINNSYWAVTFLALPAWVWILVGLSSGAGGRAANRLWIAAVAVPYLTALAYLCALGWRTVWYAVLSLSTRTFTLTGYLLASMAISIGIRFFLIQSQSRSD